MLDEYMSMLLSVAAFYCCVLCFPPQPSISISTLFWDINHAIICFIFTLLL